MASGQTASITIGGTGTASVRQFPREYRKDFFKRLDKRFTLLFFALALGLGGLLALLASREVTIVVSDKEIEKIQERYAQLVLNQPKPAPLPEKILPQPKVQEQTQQSEVAEKRAPVDRANETYEQKQERRQATSEQRAEQRQQIQKQVQSSGLFAAITAAGGKNGGGKGAGEGITDLLGTLDATTQGLGSAAIGKGTFATRKVDPASLTGRKEGVAVGSVGITKAGTGRAVGAVVAGNARVTVGTAAAQITGNEGSTSGTRTQSAIGAVITRESSKLKRAYEYWLKKDPGLSGQLKIKFTILPTGDVVNVIVVSSTTNNADFDQAIVKYIKQWKFGEDAGGSPIEVTYPFAFEGSE